MYCGEVNIPQEDLNEFIKVGEDLKVKGLETEDIKEVIDNSHLNSQRKTNPREENVAQNIHLLKEEETKVYKSTGDNKNSLEFFVSPNKKEINLELHSMKENKYWQREQMFNHIDIMILPKMVKLKGILECKECDFKNKHKTNMKNHIESNHLNTKQTKIPCLHCDILTHTRTGLRNHMKKHHTRV